MQIEQAVKWALEKAFWLLMLSGEGGGGGGGGGQKGLKSVTHPIMMKLGTVTPCLKKIQKVYESRYTSPEFCWHQQFFNGNQQILLYQEIHI